MKPETKPPKPSEPILDGAELDTYRLILAARAFCAVKSDTEEYVAGRDLLRAAVAYARHIFERSIPPP